MAFKDFSAQQRGIELLQRSLARGRLGHGYLFVDDYLDDLENIARTLAKTLNCLQPVKQGNAAVDCCDRCPACLKIDHGNHGDVHWVRPESKSRVITVAQMRDLMKEIQLKPGEAEYKVAVIVAADRLRTEAANAFLKTLEEPPPRSILLLLSTDPQRLLETILSRCLRLNFAGESRRALEPALMAWLKEFTALAAIGQKSLLGRYRLMDLLLRRLTQSKTAIEEALTARSPSQLYPDAEKEVLEKWEDELTAAIEAEYRRQRTDLLAVVQWWLRDVWVMALSTDGKGKWQEKEKDALLTFPELGATAEVARRVSPRDARENLQVLEQLQRWLGTNVQEALALEVGLLKLRI